MASNSNLYIQDETMLELEIPKEQIEFYSQLRNQIIEGTFFISLASLFYLILKRYLKKEEEEQFGAFSCFITLLINSIGLTVSIAAILLIPITLIANEIMVNYSDNYYMDWINEDLIFSFWNDIFLASNVAIFILLPFSQFFYESSSLKKGIKGILSQFYQAFIVQILFSLILFGIIFLLHSMLADSNDNYIVFCYSLISVLGSIIVLISVPIGFKNLTFLGFHFKVPYISAKKYREMEAQLKIQIQKNPTRSHLRSSSEGRNTILQLENLKVELKEAKQISIIKFAFYNFIWLSCTFINILIPALIVLDISFGLMTDFFSSSFEIITYLQEISSNLLGKTIIYIEICTIFYVITSTFVGFYHLQLFQFLHLQKEKTTMWKISFNVGLILLVSSSFPFIVKILGLTSFNLLGYYNTNYIQYSLFQTGFKITFIVSIIVEYFKIFPLAKYLLKNFLRSLKRSIKSLGEISVSKKRKKIKKN